MIYPDFESILVPEDKGKQNPELSYTNTYPLQLWLNDEMFSKPFKTCLGTDAVYKFLMVWSKKVNIAVKWWKTFLKRTFND